LWTNAIAQRLLTSPDGKQIEAVEIERNGKSETVSAPLVIVSCGAVNSAALLLRSATDKHPNGLANSSGLVGTRYMAHLATMMQGFSPARKNDTVFQKTVAVNDYYLRGPDVAYPLGHIQSQGRTHGVMAKVVGDTRRYLGLRMHRIPLWAYDVWVSRGVDWLAMSEDLPREENRVTVDSNGRIHVHYRPNNQAPHRRLVKEATRILHRLGFWKVMTHSHATQNTTHQCGTLVFGDDPRTSVLDEYCRAHDLDNLYVVDASFFPSSAAVNPGLTIIAQALRVADHIKQRAGLAREVATLAGGNGPGVRA
jgi:choline dehydrogenase-like flavoprotein